MSRWRRVVRRELARYNEETGWRVVELQELYDQMLPVLREEFPDNHNRAAKLRQVLQQLGERGELEFVDHAGTYRILDLGDGAEPTAEADSGAPDWTYEAREYETTVGARSLPAAFRDAVLSRYGAQCPVSGVDHERLLDVAHVLPWSDHEALRTAPGNVLALDKTHHAAFDADLYTLDEDYRLRVSPAFETNSDLLERTLLERAGDRVNAADDLLDTEYLRRRNESLDWW
ncbi:HNH endonuclease [Halobacterium bonnevillei]|uniref:HNH endonuclease n=1 Tax=Halobacterium bonnevillei TaxID=2692200 RepID=A0A6B0SSR7_9EURY|nr:HNH endonuclease [Halobacterium bonnevillei]MXR21840.1 HNH endonuclease [Halobacterium bonnevillei]